MKLEKIYPDLFQCKLKTVNVYFCVLDNDWIMIDTGYPGDTDSILEGVKQAGLQLKDLKHVFLTHVHPDHAGCATDLETTQISKFTCIQSMRNWQKMG